MKGLFATVIALSGALLLALPAAADGPTRSPASNPTITLSGVCAFDVTLTFPVNNEYVLTFTDSAGNVTEQIISGHLTVVFTNDATGKSLSSNFSGPAILTFYSNASPKVFEFLGPRGGPLSNTLLLGSGRTVFEFAPDGTLIDQTQVGHFTDVCAALA